MEDRISNGTNPCSSCGAPVSSKNQSKSIAQAYEHHRLSFFKRNRVLGFLLVGGDCFFIGMQPILVYMSKVDGKFLFSPISVNFLSEICKVVFAIVMLIFQSRKSKANEKLFLSPSMIFKVAQSNYLLAFPSFLYAINNYLKFILQLYFKPATVKMLGNLKILVIALLLKVVMKRKFSFLQWEALCLLLIGISINQLPCANNSSLIVPMSHAAWFYTFCSITIPSTASVYNEYALKSQFDTSVHLQNLFLFLYGLFFNSIFLLISQFFQESDNFNIFKGHSWATCLLIMNNAMQGILSSFFFKYADTILKKYSSAIATILTAVISFFVFGHSLNINFLLAISILLISMHQFFSPNAQPINPHHHQNQSQENPFQYKSHDTFPRNISLVNMASGANEEANHTIVLSEIQPLLPP